MVGLEVGRLEGRQEVLERPVWSQDDRWVPRQVDVVLDGLGLNSWVHRLSGLEGGVDGEQKEQVGEGAPLRAARHAVAEVDESPFAFL